jgi:hypothetical protein
MTTENTRQKSSVVRRIMKVLGYAGMLAVVVLAVAHFVWKYSGTNEWKLEIDKKGVQVYSRKASGSTLKDFKVVRRVKTTLNRAVAAMISTDTEDCAEWSPGCVSEKTIQPWNPRDLTYVQLYRMSYPKPFVPREFIINAKTTQDPVTKAVLVDFTTLPDAIPHNSCCIRIAGFHDQWRITPLENGEVQVELSAHVDPKLPYVIFNRYAPRGLYWFFNLGLSKYLNKPKFEQAKFEGIQEPASTATATATAAQ